MNDVSECSAHLKMNFVTELGFHFGLLKTLKNDYPLFVRIANILDSHLQHPLA